MFCTFGLIAPSRLYIKTVNTFEEEMANANIAFEDSEQKATLLTKLEKSVRIICMRSQQQRQTTFVHF